MRFRHAQDAPSRPDRLTAKLPCNSEYGAESRIVLGLLNSLGWMVFPFLMNAGAFDAEAGFFTVMRIFGTFSWMLTAVGVVMLALAASGLRRRVQALESIMAGSQADRVA